MYNYGNDDSIDIPKSAADHGRRHSAGPMRKPIYDHPNRTVLPDEKSGYVNPLCAAGKIIGIKQSVEYLEKSVREKEILLNELQHRVKNDLNMILGLINLEMERNTSRSERLILNALKTRIYTIASVYRQLCPSNIFGIIDLRSHIRNLADSLVRTYAIENRNMLIRTNLQEVKVDIKNASLLGLMVNELVTNAIKYAVPYGEKGEIRIYMARAGGQAIISVSDNGPGMPDGFDPYAANSLGLKLVRMISEQIGGALTIDSIKGKGTSVTIAFPHMPDE